MCHWKLYMHISQDVIWWYNALNAFLYIFHFQSFWHKFIFTLWVQKICCSCRDTLFTVHCLELQNHIAHEQTVEWSSTETKKKIKSCKITTNICANSLGMCCGIKSLRCVYIRKKKTVQSLALWRLNIRTLRSVQLNIGWTFIYWNFNYSFKNLWQV